MVDQNENKDTASEYNYKPNRFSAISHFFIGCGVFIMCAGIFVILGGILVGIDIKSLLNGIDIFEQISENPYLLKLFVFISSSLPLIVAAVLVALIIRANPKDYLLLNKPLNIKWFILSTLFIFISIPLMGPLLELNGKIDFESISPQLYEWLHTQELANNTAYESMIGEKNLWSFLTSILFMALMPALAEELFFRGFLMNVLNGIFKNMHIAIFATAILFSLLHMQFLKALPMFFLAIVFGYAVFWTRSIWTSIIAHFINNTIAVIQLYFFTDGDYNKALESGPSLPFAGNNTYSFSGLGSIYLYTKKF